MLQDLTAVERVTPVDRGSVIAVPEESQQALLDV